MSVKAKKKAFLKNRKKTQKNDNFFQSQNQTRSPPKTNIWANPIPIPTDDNKSIPQGSTK
jgi:hypothetical protein